jgi:hypothetical protein
MRVRPHRWLFGLLLIALLGTQGLGVLHAVLHARAPVAAVASSAPERGLAGAPAVHGAARAGAWVGLFDTHHSGGDCQMFDQASHGDQAAAPPALPAPVCSARQSPPRWVPSAGAAHRLPQFDARAPPARG